jgi:hypothetical protein
MFLALKLKLDEALSEQFGAEVTFGSIAKHGNHTRVGWKFRCQLKRRRDIRT